MLSWSVQNAKSRFSELLETCIHNKPQIVTKRGKEVAVLVSIQEWQRLQAMAKPSLKQLLLGDDARYDNLLPEKPSNHSKKRRSIPTFE